MTHNLDVTQFIFNLNMYRNMYMYPLGFPMAVRGMASFVRILIPFPGGDRGEDGVDGNSQGSEGLATTGKGCGSVTDAYKMDGQDGGH